MPATDFVRYCAHCDLSREAIAHGATTETERAGLLTGHPRRLATKTDADGTPLCAACLEYVREHRRLDFFDRTVPGNVAAADDD